MQAQSAASKRPTQLHPNGPNPGILLPPSASVSWVWRANKCHAIGIETSTFRLQEVPEIAQDRAISTLSTRNRGKRLQQIRDSANAEDWRRRAWARLEAEQRQYEKEQRRRAEELERLSGLLAKYRRYEEKSQQTRDEVEDILRTQTDKVTDIPSGRKWLVLGYRRSRATSAPRVVLRCCKDDEETTCVVWATQGLESVLDGCADVFEADADKFGRTTFWLPPIGDGTGLEIEIEPARVFQPMDGRKVSWNPIGVVAAPDPQRLATLQALAEKKQEHQAQLEAEQRAREQSCLLEAPAPNPRDTKKALDLPSGEYLCRRNAPTTFRGAPRTLLFLVPADEDGEPATDVETPTYGLFPSGPSVGSRSKKALWHRVHETLQDMARRCSATAPSKGNNSKSIKC